MLPALGPLLFLTLSLFTDVPGVQDALLDPERETERRRRRIEEELRAGRGPFPVLPIWTWPSGHTLGRIGTPERFTQQARVLEHGALTGPTGGSEIWTVDDPLGWPLLTVVVVPGSSPPKVLAAVGVGGRPLSLAERAGIETFLRTAPLIPTRGVQ